MPDPMTPVTYIIQSRKKESDDVVTLRLTSGKKGKVPVFAPGQFNMLYALGVGEIPISMSGDPSEPGFVHTIRSVGMVSRRLASLDEGDALGVRGPFGSPWPIDKAKGKDVIVAAGGLGMAPLRPVVYAILGDRDAFGSVFLLYGTRTPSDLLFRREIETWRKRGRIEVLTAVGQATAEWKGEVGHVTTLIPKAFRQPGGLRPENTVGFLCGPEVMMRFTAYELERRGVSPASLFVSLERNMKCAIAFCGHCQFGPHFVCKDGPVFSFDRVDRLLRIREA